MKCCEMLCIKLKIKPSRTWFDGFRFVKGCLFKIGQAKLMIIFTVWTMGKRPNTWIQSQPTASLRAVDRWLFDSFLPNLLRLMSLIILFWLCVGVPSSLILIPFLNKNICFRGFKSATSHNTCGTMWKPCSSHHPCCKTTVKRLQLVANIGEMG